MRITGNQKKETKKKWKGAGKSTWTNVQHEKYIKEKKRKTENVEKKGDKGEKCKT